MSTALTRCETLLRIDEFRGAREFVLVPQGEEVRSWQNQGALDQSRDVDYWCPRQSRSAVRSRLEALGGYLLCASTSGRWLNHDVYLFPCADGNLQVDVTIGDLMAGPVTLAPERSILRDLTSDGRFGGLAAIADLLLRPVWRGSRVPDSRLFQVRDAWQAMGEAHQQSLRLELAENVGTRTARGCESVLEGGRRLGWLRLQLLILAGARTIGTPGAAKIAARKLWTWVAGRVTGRGRPFGRFHRGALVVFVGTDGVGKSSTIESLAARLAAQRTAASVHYLGRSRGNLPGVETLRNLIGRRVRRGDATADVYGYAILNRVVTWYYALEYCFRTITPCVEARCLGKVVLCDRYVYDLELIPGHSRTAVRFSRWSSPRPDLLVMLDAPASIVHSRKQERDLATIVAQQDTFRRVVEASLARHQSLVLSTDELSQEEICDRLLCTINPAIHPDFS